MKVDQAEYDDIMAGNDASGGMILTLQRGIQTKDYHFIFDDKPIDDVTLLLRGLLQTMKAHSIIDDKAYEDARLQFRRSR